MNFLIEDIIYELFKKLSISDAYKLSTISKAYYNIFECAKLWNYYIESIDLNTLHIIQSMSCKVTYRKFRDLNNLIKLLKLDVNVLTLYQKIRLDLYEQIISIPSEIGQLVNLQYLDLCCNQITSIPSEIGQLVNLQSLY